MNNISVPEEEPKKNVKIDKTRMKMIKELKKDEAYLKNNLFALTNNENLLKNDSFLSLSGKATNSIDSVILKNKLKDIAKTKERRAEISRKNGEKAKYVVYSQEAMQKMAKGYEKVVNNPEALQKMTRGYETRDHVLERIDAKQFITD